MSEIGVLNKYQAQLLDSPPGVIDAPTIAYEKDYLLPTTAKEKGVRLLSVMFGYDPYVLYNKDGRILHFWECGYVPGVFEVEAVCRELGLSV